MHRFLYFHLSTLVQKRMQATKAMYGSRSKSASLTSYGKLEQIFLGHLKDNLISSAMLTIACRIIEDFISLHNIQ